MTVDITRKSFDPRRHTAWTTVMQGRVATDAPRNENQAQRDRRVRALLADVAGRCGYPKILPDSFKVGIAGGELTVAPGRYYVDGHLADNFGAGAEVFDPVLSELRGADPIAFSAQPYGTANAPGPTDGLHIAFVDVWQRDVTFLEDETILDPAIATDAFARRQTVWQLRAFGPVGAGTSCSTESSAIAGWDEAISPSLARLSARANPASAIDDPCLLPPGALYRGIDNRTYLVAIHGFDGAGAPLLKFSRTNGSVATAILALPQGDVLEVAQVARDNFLRFNAGDWVEITDEARLLAGQAGTMARLLSVDDGANTVTLEDPLPAGALVLIGAGPDANQTVHPVLRRWDQAGEIRDENGIVLVDLDAPGATGLIPAPTGGTFIALEDGVEVALTFATGIGGAHVNDNWSFFARYADTSVEELDAAPPQDFQHHYCRLAMVEAAGGVFTQVLEDCRTPLSGEECCCTVTVEVGGSIQDAINSIPVNTGGCVCLVAGIHEVRAPLELRTSNVRLVGESRGAIVECREQGTALRVEDTRNVDIDMIQFRTVDDGGKAVLEIVGCENLNVERCAFRSLKGLESVGVAVSGSDDVDICNCDFAALALGVVTFGEGGRLTVADNVFELSGEGAIGQAAVLARKSTAPLRITGNNIAGVLNGIILNDDFGSDTRHSLSSESLIADNQVSLRFFEQAGDFMQVGIDSAADQCTIRGNRIQLDGRTCMGIFVSGSELAVVENQVEIGPNTETASSGGIAIGALDERAAHVTEKVTVAHNFIGAVSVGVVVAHTSDVVVADNHLGGSERQLVALMLNDAVATTVRGNDVGRTGAGLFGNDGRSTTVLENRFAASGMGIVVVDEYAATLEGNIVEEGRTFGIAIWQATGRTAVTGNRLRNCGSAGGFSGGILAMTVVGELAICNNEVVDAGLATDGKPNPAAVFGIVGIYILEALVSENLVTTTMATARPDGLEDRALALLGQFEWSLGDNEPTFGFPCTIAGNKFYGKGFSALVQVTQVQVSQNSWVRFERLFFTHNYCNHFEPRKGRAATVDLVGRGAVISGNHVKGYSDGPSFDLKFSKGTVIANVTTGPILGLNFPINTTDFNALL